MISHDNLTWTSRTTLDHVAETGWGNGDESLISYLPLSHIAAQLLDIHAPMSITAFRKGHVCVWFAQPDALKGSLGTTLKEVGFSFARTSLPASILVLTFALDLGRRCARPCF